MTLPFGKDAFLGVFVAYNEAIWPAQGALLLLGWGIAAAALVGPRSHAQKAIPLGLATLWLWSGAIFHLGFFLAVSPAAALFGGLAVLQAALLVAWGRRDSPVLDAGSGARRWTGLLALGYALVGYPLLNVTAGHGYPAMPTFGAPCPTTLATLGLLAWAIPRAPWWLAAIPVAWAAVGTSAAFELGVVEDLGLGITALAFLAVRAAEGHRVRAESAAARG